MAALFKAASLVRCATKPSKLHRLHRHICTSVPPHTNEHPCSLAHSSWFKLEDQGMTDFELLAHGSSFVIRSPNSDTTLALVSAHVAAPHRFPAYFPHEWLKHVTDSDCRSIFQHISSPTPPIIDTKPLIHGFRHASLDVAAFILKPDIDLPVSVLTLHENELSTGDTVTIDGFALHEGTVSGSGSERMVARRLHGHVSNIRKPRVFVDTGEQLSEMGMCGGPALLADQPNICVGLLEGLVPPLEDGEPVINKEEGKSELHVQLQNKSVLVSAEELHKFVLDIEKDIQIQQTTRQKTR